MRDILFRSYSKLLKEYIVKEFSIFGEWLTFDMFGQFISENWEKYKEHYDSKLLAVNDFFVEQFTGLLDKNGKKIFEGDQLKYDNNICTVEWSKTQSRFVLWIPKANKFVSLLAGISYEVIGNIHDNPELLEATK